jgi:hypothetical protein
VGDVLAEQLDLAVQRGLLRAQGEQLVVVGVALALGAAAGDHRLRLAVGKLLGADQPGGEQGRGRDVDGSGRVVGVRAGAGQLAVLDPAAQRVDRLAGQVGGLAQGVAPVVGVMAGGPPTGAWASSAERTVSRRARSAIDPEQGWTIRCPGLPRDAHRE